MHRRSVSDSNYESLYLQDGGDNKEEYESSLGHGSSHQAESGPHDDLKVLTYLDDEKIESNDGEAPIEKKLDLFVRIEANNSRYRFDFYFGGRDNAGERMAQERSDAPAVNPVLVKNTSAPPGIRIENMTALFNPDVELSIVKENNSPSRQDSMNATKSPSNSVPSVSIQHHVLPAQSKVPTVNGYEGNNQIPALLPMVPASLTH